MDNSKSRHNNSLGVNKMGRNIRKSPLNQPDFSNNAARPQQPQPQVYNISKNDFRDIVQQLTGSPSHDPPPRPPQNSPKPQSMRLQTIRPPPLAPINSPRMPPQMPVLAAPSLVPYDNWLARPPQFQLPSSTSLQPLTPGDIVWANTAESPISAYMRHLQSSIVDPGPRGNLAQPQPPPPQPHLQAQGPGNVQPQPPSSALLPKPPLPMVTSPRQNGPPPPLMNAAPNPPVPYIPSPQSQFPPLLPSPSSQFLLPSPTAYMNLLSPRSPYPLLSPSAQFPYPLTPNFPFSPMAQPGILGPGPQTPSASPVYPLSPSGFFPILSPRWRDQ